jgi:enoyl-CoA hydratase
MNTTPSFETLIVTLEDHIATVRLNRPEKANAMNAAMWQEIRQAFTVGGCHARSPRRRAAG